MEIRIETDGNLRNTKVTVNGQEIKHPELVKFHISSHDSGRIKLQLHKSKDGVYTPISMYGDDFKEYDQMNRIGGRENGVRVNKKVPTTTG